MSKTPTKENVADRMKELLSDPKYRIQLDDYVNQHIKVFLEATNEEHFPTQGSNVQKEDFVNRVHEYEDVVSNLRTIVVLLARWGEGESLALLEKVFRRITETEVAGSGLVLWLRLRWYPIHLLLYSAGLAALSARRYSVLRLIFSLDISSELTNGKHIPLVVASSSYLAEINDSFKLLDGHERAFVPRSEHLFLILKEPLEELLFLGASYERLFDEFEVFLSLSCIELAEHKWGPIGRFGWKHDRGSNSPFTRIAEEADKYGAEWEPLQQGLFKNRKEVAEMSIALEERLNKLTWW